jgi:hypothetical protein
MATLSQTNQPVSNGVTTASYTVPAGKYARVKAYFYQPRLQSVSNSTYTFTLGYITLNGNNILPENTLIGSATCTTSLSSGTINFPFSADVTITSSSFSGNASVSATINSITASNVTINAGAATINGTWKLSSPSIVEFWAKPGDVISASAGNFRIIFEEYTATF